MTDKKQLYVRELSKVGHLEFGPASQDLHQVEAFVGLQPADGGEEEPGGRR